MTALQTSSMSLYEVSDITPGQSLRARDLIRGGEPVLVRERSATQSLRPWDRIAARIVPNGDRLVLGGGLLVFTREGSELLDAGLREGLGRMKRLRRPPRGRRGGTTRLGRTRAGLRGRGPPFNAGMARR